MIMVRIRYMKKSEIDIITSFRREHLGEFIEDKFKRYVLKNPSSVLIADEGPKTNKILGYAFAYLWRTDTGIIHHLLSIPESKDMVEPKLLEHLQHIFKHRKLNMAYAWATENQKSLIKHLYGLEYNLECEMLVFENEKLEFASDSSQGNMKVNILDFEEEYLDDIMKIETLCFKPSWHQREEEFLKYAKRPNTWFSVAVDNEKVVGYLQAAASHNLGYLGRVAVLPGYQRKGIGTRFTHEAMKWFEKNNANNIKLRSPQTDIPAHNLYKKFGFSKTGKEYEFVKKF
jgi:ribosomal-protein-alanine N-acetyltransferase